LLQPLGLLPETLEEHKRRGDGADAMWRELASSPHAMTGNMDLRSLNLSPSRLLVDPQCRDLACRYLPEDVDDILKDGLAEWIQCQIELWLLTLKEEILNN
jgi:hypothetical protein